MRTKSMSVKDNVLYMGEHRLQDLAKEYGTPLYVYDEIGINDKIRKFKDNFHSEKFNCEVVYASKAFIAPYLCKILEKNDLSIDSVSEGDLYLLKKSGFPMNKVVAHGNNKLMNELIMALDHGVEYLVVDNLTELLRLEYLASRKKKKLKTLIRINPGIEAHTHAYIETSLLSSKFGESIHATDILEQMVEVYRNSEYLTLEGFHAHIGSQINNPNSFISEVKTMCQFMRDFSQKTKFEFKTLDIGGGFAIKYLDEDVEIDLPTMLNLIVKAVEEEIEDTSLKIEKLMIEPGRSLVGDSGITLYTCGSKKTTFSGKKYIFIDGGMADNIRPALYQAKYSVDIANQVNTPVKEMYDVVGKCCESGDIIVKDAMIGEIHKGDTMVVYSTGAYCYSMSMNYNSLVRGAVIFVNGQKVTTAIRRQSFEHLFDTCVYEEKEMKIFDIHSDMLYDLYKQSLIGNNTRFVDFHVPQLQNSCIKGAIWTMYSPDDFNLLKAVKVAMSKINLKDLPGFQVIFGLEGLRNLEKVEDINKLYKLGFRHAMLTWNEANKYATGVAGDANRGLTDEGEKLIKRMEELDMIIDLAHLNEKSFYDVLKISNKNIVYSHGCVKDICNHRRNVTDDQMKALKKVDGLLGLTLAKNFVSSIEEEKDLEHFLVHLDYAVDIMGVDNVCFGFDFMDYLSEFPNDNIVDVPNATKAYRIIDGMRKNGYSEEEINKICWGNFYNRFKDKIMLKGE